jgi:hypothetical protein
VIGREPKKGSPVNAPLNHLVRPNGAAPKPGAIMLSETSPIGRAGDWIEFDMRGGGIVNLSNGALLPMAGGRAAGGGQMMFAGTPPSPTDVHTPIAIAGYLASTATRSSCSTRSCRNSQSTTRSSSTARSTRRART